MRKLSSLLPLLLVVFAGLGGCSRVDYRVGSAKMICVLAGDAANRRWPPDSDAPGTDAGASFAGPFGSTFFLFGDTTDQPFGQVDKIPGADAIAFSTDVAAGDCPNLIFFQQGGRIVSPQIFPLGDPHNFPGLFEAPSGGFYSGGRPYVAYTIDASVDPDGALRPHHGALTRGDTTFQDASGSIKLNVMFHFPSAKFITVYPLRIDANGKPISDPGAREQSIYFFGTGEYRKSTDVYLAKIDVSGLANGLNGLNGEQDWISRLRYYAPSGWTPDESKAASILAPPSSPCMGEFSVTWNAALGKWLMLYNCDSPRGILFRAADQPWGPFGAAGVLFNPDRDKGYCNFMHANDRRCDYGAPTPVLPPHGPPIEECVPPLCYRECVQPAVAANPPYCWTCPHGAPNACNSLGDPNNPPWRYGGEYAPYVIDALTRTNGANSTTIKFAMSTWNPYQVVLMQATLDRVWW